jgi:UDP-glucose 4-epimerase
MNRYLFPVIYCLLFIDFHHLKMHKSIIIHRVLLIPDFLGDVFERERPTHVCHLAARAGVRASIIDPYIYVHSNIEGEILPEVLV